MKVPLPGNYRLIATLSAGRVTGKAQTGSFAILRPTILLVAFALALSGCGTQDEERTRPSPPKISQSQAEAIWLKKFKPLVEAHAPGETRQTLHSPGVEQQCKYEDGAYHCLGIVPEEEGQFIPGHEENCIVATMMIDNSGHIASEAADPIDKYRELFKAEIDCRI